MTADMAAPGALLEAAARQLEYTPVPGDQVAAGAPQTGWLDLGPYGGVDLGVWEMTPGGMRDTEVDEVFVVLSGDATVEFLRMPDGSTPPPAIHLRPGSVVRLIKGMETLWTVREALRKVFIGA